MNIEYVSQDEIEAHEAAMQRLIEEKKSKQKSINDKKKRAIEAAQREFNERSIKAAEDESDQAIVATEAASESKLAAMQRDFECLPLLRQVYHEAPDDLRSLLTIPRLSDIFHHLIHTTENEQERLECSI